MEKAKEILLGKIIAEFEHANNKHNGPIAIDLDSVYEIVESLFNQKKDWRIKFSEECLKEKINNIIISMVNDGNCTRASNYLNEMIEDLDSYCLVHVVYTPLSGIKMLIPSVKLGNVTLKCMDEDGVAELIAKIHPHISIHEDIYKYLLKHVCSEFRTVAEPIYATERAEEETRKAIDLLRYAIPFIAGQRSQIGLEGEIFRTHRITLASSISGKGVYKSGSIVGPLGDLEISPQNIKIMKMIGIFRLSRMLQKDKMTNFEEAVLSSVHWFSNSQMKAGPEDQLLNLITCLEIILTPMDRDPIIQSVAEGIAIIIGRNAADRKKRIKQVRELYGKRSSLSHHGKGKVNDKDLWRLKQIALSLLRSVIDKSDEFKTLKEFHKWLEYRRMGGSLNQRRWNRYLKAISESKRNKFKHKAVF